MAKGNVQHAREGLRQQRLARAGGPDQQDIRFRQLHVARLAVQENPLVMVVDRDGQLLLGFVLADDVAVEERLDFGRARQPAIDRAGLFALLLFEDLLADAHALVADVGARIVGRRTDQLLDLLLRLVAERTAQRFVRVKFSHRFMASDGLFRNHKVPPNILGLLRARYRR